MGEVADLERKLATANLQVDKSIKRVWELEAQLINGLLSPTQSDHPVLGEVRMERSNQDARWGEQNHPNISGDDKIERQNGWADELRKVRADEKYCRDKGSLGWDLILLEEVFEALSEPDPGKLREELVQVAAVAVAWIEALDRREAREQKGTH